MADDIPQLIKDMADALTAATEVQNRYWLSVAVTSLFVVVPQSATGGMLVLPFGLPAVDSAWFGLLGVLGLSALFTAFASAEARLVRTQKLFFGILADRKDGGCDIAGHDERDFLDALRRPSLGTVAPLAQVVRGEHQFFRDADLCPGPRLRASKILYMLFKLPAIAVWLFLPAAGLCFAIRRFSVIGLPDGMPAFVGWLVWLLVAVAVLSLVFTIWLELGYLWNVIRKIWAKAASA